MAIRWGKCVKKSCEEAQRGDLIPISDGEAFECPLCGEPLIEEGAEAPVPVETPAPRASAFTSAATMNTLVSPSASESGNAPAKKRSSPVALIVGVLLLVAILGVGGYFVWNRLHGANATGTVDPEKTILRLAGSNTIGDELGPALAAAFLKDQGATDIQIHAGAKPEEKFVQGVLPGDTSPSFITIAAHGSATAFTALAGQTCDIGMASRKIKPDEAAKLTSLGDMLSPASEHVLGLDGIAVIVSSSNSVDRLDKDQIMRIFTGDITDWSKVGGSQGAIKVYARDDKSGTYDTFKTLVLAGKPLAPGAQRFEDSKALSEAVAADPNGIGFIGLPYILSAKAIAVSDKGTVPLMPTRLTVSTEDYLLSRRLYLYSPGSPTGKYTRKFIELAISKAGQDVVGNSGFVTQNVSEIAQTAPEDAPQEYKQLTRDASRLSLDFRFQAGQTALDNKAKVDLDRVVSLIADMNYTGDNVMLFGFSDGSGNSGSNQALSLTRANAVEELLVQRGLKPAIVRGFGSRLPIASNDTEDGQARNRRVEIWVKK